MYRKDRASSIGLTTTLLGLGAKPNAVWHEETVWSETLQYVPTVIKKGVKNPALVPAFLDSLKLLMNAGASDFPPLEHGRRQISDSRRMIGLNFRKEVADDLIMVGKRARVYENPHNLKTIMKARMRRWGVAVPSMWQDSRGKRRYRAWQILGGPRS